MKIKSNSLLQDLTSRVEKVNKRIEHFKTLSLTELNKKETPESWSILECIEHLNLYGDFYIPEIENKISNSKYNTPTDLFQSGWLGNYFANSMLPNKNGKIQKMKTFKDKNPVGSRLNINTLDKFLQQQNALLTLLKKAEKVDLNKTKTNISISTLIKLRLGDTFRFFIYHIERHIAQAERCL